MNLMSRSLSRGDYQALAEFRYRIRCFLNSSEQAARAAGVEPQQYQLLLAVKGLPGGQPATIRNLAERLQVRHHSAVELVDRLEQRGLFRRTRGKKDRREVHVHLTARGERVLAKLAGQRLAELRESGPSLVRALGAVVAATNHAKPRRRVSRREQK